MTPEQMNELAGYLAVPFYEEWSFWIGNLVGVLSLVFSILAFVEARRAKLAASDAGRIVKIQTITIELTEIAQRLDKLDFGLEFSRPKPSGIQDDASRRICAGC